MTFKSKVEEILIDGIKTNEPVRITRDRILALIAADRAERVCKRCFKAYDAHSLCPVCQLKSTDDAFDKGFEVGKTEAARDRAGLEGLLREAKSQIEYLQEKFGETGTGNAVLAKIEQALKEGK